MTAYTSKKSLTEAIRAQITSSDSQAIKAMLRIYEYQSADEQDGGYVSDLNGVGFVCQDAEILTSFCNQYMQRGSLSPKQMEIIRKKIGKYAGQLVKHAIENGIYVKENGAYIIATR